MPGIITVLASGMLGVALVSGLSGPALAADGSGPGDTGKASPGLAIPVSALRAKAGAPAKDSGSANEPGAAGSPRIIAAQSSAPPAPSAEAAELAESAWAAPSPVDPSQPVDVPAPVEPYGPKWLTAPDGSFSIHATEVTVDQWQSCVDFGACDPREADRRCNLGDASRGNYPINCVSYYGADRFCEAVGGRICQEKEWLTACAGSEGRKFPYGNDFSAEACNASSNTVQVEDRPRSTMEVGSLESCEGGFEGLYDMAGNVAEWVNGCNGTYCKFRGGAYYGNDPVDLFASCSKACSGNQKTLKSGQVGFRCCRSEP